MRDRVSRHIPIAGENLDITGHPAKEKFGEFAGRLDQTGGLEDKSEEKLENVCESPYSIIEKELEKERKIEQMDEVIKEDIERAKE